MSIRLTERSVKAAEIGTRKYVVFDDDCPGFGLCVYESGRKGFVLIYRSSGRQRRLTIGTCPRRDNQQSATFSGMFVTYDLDLVVEQLATIKQIIEIDHPIAEAVRLVQNFPRQLRLNVGAACGYATMPA